MSRIDSSLYCPVKGQYCHTLTNADTAASLLDIEWRPDGDKNRYASKNGLYYYTGGSRVTDRILIFDEKVDKTQRTAADVATVMAQMRDSREQFDTMDEFIKAYLR